MRRSIGKVKLEPDGFAGKVMGLIRMDIELFLWVKITQVNQPGAYLIGEVNRTVGGVRPGLVCIFIFSWFFINGRLHFA